MVAILLDIQNHNSLKGCHYYERMYNLVYLDPLYVELLKTKYIPFFQKISMEEFSMPITYIHGDIIKSNLILDNNDKVWVIDFSVLNYLPRVIELGVAMFGICLTDDRTNSLNNMNIFINEYNKYNRLDNYEIINLPIIFNCISAMNVLQTAYIKNTDDSNKVNL